MNTYTRGILWAVAGTFFYSFLGLSIKFAGQDASTWQIMLGRGIAGIGFSLVLAKLFGISLINGQILGMLLTGCANAGAATLITVSLTTIPLFEALVLWYLLPAWTTILGIFIFKERPTVFGITCVVIPIIGVLIILWPEESQGISSLTWGHLAGLLSSVSIAFGFVFIRYFSNQHAISHFFYFSFVASVMSAVFLLIGQTPVMPTQFGLIGIGLAALFGGFGQIFIFRSLAFIPSTEVSIITMGEIVISAIVAYFLFHEGITLRVFIGGLLIIGSGLAINIYNTRKTLQVHDV